MTGTEWLLFFVLMTQSGKLSMIDSIDTSRLATREECEDKGASLKRRAKLQAAFTCIEVAKIKRK